jgi:Mlc titration factor MtfA (ptsG expression regulator)
MLDWLSRWRERRIIAASTLDEEALARAFAALPLLDRLTPAERGRLRELAVLFLHDKDIQGLGELQLTDTMRLSIALQACLPVLHLGLGWYDDWVSVLVYPDEFLVSHSWEDEDGVVHEGEGPLSGEAWDRGPVILSWSDVCAAGDDGYNLVIHEFAHKLDMRNGGANGFPPLHRDMQPAEWSATFNSAYEDFTAREEAGEELPFDDYASESPAEFFAVTSEIFFEAPARLRDLYPAVYRQLALFYRQDPAAALPGC